MHRLMQQMKTTRHLHLFAMNKTAKPGGGLIRRLLRGLGLVAPGKPARAGRGVAGLVGIEGGVVSGVINLESSGVEAPDWRPRHDGHYHEA